MGRVRLYVEETPGSEGFVPLPEYWDEMDKDERADWAKESLVAFVDKHVKSGYEITE